MNSHSALFHAALDVQESIQILGQAVLSADKDGSITDQDTAYIGGHVSSILAIATRLLDALKNVKQNA